MNMTNSINPTANAVAGITLTEPLLVVHTIRHGVAIGREYRLIDIILI
jgi:hypothetical protein